MKRRLATVAVTTGLVAGLLASPASADPVVGQPANPSCFGEQASGFAQDFGGLPNAAAAFGVTLQEGHNLVRGFCGRTSGFVPTP